MDPQVSALLAMLTAATEYVEPEYFQLPQAGADEVYRERVYCYELYHQIRRRWNDFPFTLGGEVDKAGHPVFKDSPYGRAKPDFLVHRPGDMAYNLAVIEVKPATASLDALCADVTKLTWFCHHAQYRVGILLVYGELNLSEHAQVELMRQVDTAGAHLLLPHHAAVGRTADLICDSEWKIAATTDPV